jgi:hypothetical protein
MHQELHRIWGPWIKLSFPFCLLFVRLCVCDLFPRERERERKRRRELGSYVSNDLEESERVSDDRRKM